MKRLLATPPVALDATERARLNAALGLALAQIGEERGDGAALREAIAAFRAALDGFTRDRAPLDWALTTANLARALLLRGNRGAGLAAWTEALGLVEASLPGLRLRQPDAAERPATLAAALRGSIAGASAQSVPPPSTRSPA